MLSEDMHLPDLSPAPRRRRPYSFMSFCWFFEVVTVVVLIGVLSALTLKENMPVIRITRSLDALNISAVLNSEIYRFYLIHGYWPSTDDLDTLASLLKDTRVIADISVSDGSYDLTFSSTFHDLEGHVLSFRKAEFTGQFDTPIIWLCGFQPVPEGMSVNATNNTTLPRALLPRICK